MIKDRTVFKIALCLAVLCMAGGIYFRYMFRLREPVFLENEKAVQVNPIEGGEAGWYANLTLRYITDEKDDKMVWFVEFPELEETVYFGEHGESPDLMTEKEEQYGQYYLHTVTGQIRQDSQPFTGNRAVITKGVITFTDGSSQTAELGKIMLVYDESVKGKRLAENRALVSKTIGGIKQILNINCVGTMTVKEIFFPETVENLFTVKINEEELADFSSVAVRPEDALVLTARGKIPLIEEYRFIDRRPVVLFEIIAGGDRQTIAFELSQPPEIRDMNCFKIWNYLNKRGVF